MSMVPSVFGSVSPTAAGLIEGVLDKGEQGVRREGSQLLLVHADFCPFANRAWIALLEKEADPKQPKLFDEIHSCYWMGDREPGTACLYSLGVKTVPAVVREGRILSESALVADFVDDLLPGPSLKPQDPTMRFNMNRFREMHAPLVPAFYGYLKAQDAKAQEEWKEKLVALLTTFDTNLGKVEDGPYLCGEQFTLADIDLVGFIERIIHLLSHYRGFTIPAHLSRIQSWWAAVSARASVRVVTAPRGDLSVATQAFEARERVPYLIEVFETYSRNDLPTCREVMAESGAPGDNAYHRFLQSNPKQSE
jgi:glutathione S-transferase